MNTAWHQPGGFRPATAYRYDCPHKAQLIFIASTVHHTGSCCESSSIPSHDLRAKWGHSVAMVTICTLHRIYWGLDWKIYVWGFRSSGIWPAERTANGAASFPLGDNRQCTYNVTYGCFRERIFAVEKLKYTYSECVCSLSYLACKAHAPNYTVICGLSGSTIFSHFISQKARFSKEKIS